MGPRIREDKRGWRRRRAPTRDAPMGDGWGTSHESIVLEFMRLWIPVFTGMTGRG